MNLLESRNFDSSILQACTKVYYYNSKWIWKLLSETDSFKPNFKILWTTVLVYFVLVHLQFFYADIWCKVTVDVLLWHSIGLLVHSGFLDPVLWLTCGFHCYLCGQSEIVCDTKQYTMCVSTCVLCEFNIQYYSCLAAHGCVMSLSLSEMKQNFCLLSFNTVFLRRVLACGQFATRQTIGLASECFLCCIIHIDTYVFWHLFALF